MHPILFQFGSFTIYTYGVLVATGFMAALWYSYRRAPRVGLDPNEVWNLIIYGVLVALAVSKIWLILGSWDYYSANPREIFSMATFQAAGVFYGGMLGAILWLVLYTHFQKISSLAVLDLIARTAEHGRRHGISVSLCGDMAGDPACVPALLHCGLRELSVNAPALPPRFALFEQTAARLPPQRAARRSPRTCR